MGGNPITVEVAAKALKKLEAVDETTKADAHPTFAIYHDNKLVATTGLRRSSNRDIPVPHIKKDLRVSANFVLGLAHCSKYKNDWLKQLGLIKDKKVNDKPEKTGGEPASDPIGQ